jgi:hypothetical protein
MKRRVIVVDGPLAFHMRRLEAARACDLGLEILTLPLLAARLAGGFCRLANRDLLAPAIAAALDSGDFKDIEEVHSLPGMVRAVMQTMDRIWASDLDLDALAKNSSRLSDLALIQQRVRAALPAGAMLTQDARDAALTRIQFAPAVFGSLTLDRLVDVDPVWRPLLIALASRIDISWTAIGFADRSWFPGTVTVSEETTPQQIEGDLCADPRAEVVEALRWARELLSRGDVAAPDIAIVAALPATWDEHMLVLSRDASLPLHFSHGLPALSTWEGQGCAALADILVNGLSQDRVRRLLRRTSSPTSDSLPSDWEPPCRDARVFSLSSSGAKPSSLRVRTGKSPRQLNGSCCRSSICSLEGRHGPMKPDDWCSAPQALACGRRRCEVHRPPPSSSPCKACVFVMNAIPATVWFGVRRHI